ncbi:MAG TPA: AAA family ATPase [Epulopiscium sp.]|nr:AAA family ATPase [Candidatus Epulonipiscium sp.]
MIKQIQINNIATYKKEVLMDSREINFCYGGNGSGKTTLSNLLYHPVPPIDCDVLWENGNKLSVLVYNKKFVEDNFEESKKINGIFTLGQDTKETQEFIEDCRKKAKNCDKLIETYTKSKSALEREKDKLEEDIQEVCWVIQQKYGDKYSKALTGFRGSKKAFVSKCILEYTNMDEKNPSVLAELEVLYSMAFDETRELHPMYDVIEMSEVLKNEQCSLLSKRISGSAETPIGKFIEFLENSDWIKQGIDYAKESAGKCPYCQQMISDDIQQNIESFFDETYEKECRIMQSFKSNYEAFTNSLLARLGNMLDNPIQLLDYELLKSEVDVLKVLIDSNTRKVQAKVASPASVTIIDSLSPIIQQINAIIVQFNATIKKNNDIVQDQANERKRCEKLLWAYFCYELRTSIKQYQESSQSKTSGMKALQNKLKSQNDEKEQCIKLITEREEKLTSVAPTVDAINGILKSFGFNGFKLKENTEEKGTYKIIRPDGRNARKSLSEGEYNFITFLYFYHLVYGSQSKTNIGSDKVVVIDDPISSLDSNVLFIISTLVKTVLRDCKDGGNGIRQIFILTHNVHFYKEVTFLGSREKYPPSKTAYWMIKKTNNISDIIFYEENPIQTSYELLWAELKNVDNYQQVTIFNTLRRILEYYFNVIGGLDYEKCIDKFEGEDKIVCKALISCINDGSHFISDDFVMCLEGDAMQRYLDVFEMIFDKMNHMGHYSMMMERIGSAAV